MIQLQDYFSDKTNLYEDIEEIIGLNKEERGKLNMLTLNIIIKFISSYLFIEESNIEGIKRRVNEIIESRFYEKGLDHLGVLTGSSFIPTKDHFALGKHGKLSLEIKRERKTIFSLFFIKIFVF